MFCKSQTRLGTRNLLSLVKYLTLPRKQLHFKTSLLYLQRLPCFDLSKGGLVRLYIYIDPYHIQINAYEALHRVHMALTEYPVRRFLNYSWTFFLIRYSSVSVFCSEFSRFFPAYLYLERCDHIQWTAYLSHL